MASVDFMVLGQYLYVETAGGSSGAAGLMQVVAINGNPPGPYTEIIRGVTPVPPPVVPALPAGIEITPVGPPPKSPGINLNSVDIVVPPPGETVTVELPDLTGITVGKDLFVTEVEAERGTKRGLKVTAKLRVTAVAGNAVTLLNPG